MTMSSPSPPCPPWLSPFPVQRCNLLRRCSCLSVDGWGVRPLGPQLRQHFSSESLARTSSPNFQLGRVVFALNSAFDFGPESQHLAVCQPSLYSNCKTVKKQNKLTQTKPRTFQVAQQIQRKVKEAPSVFPQYLRSGLFDL